MLHRILATIALAGSLSLPAGAALADSYLVDLTHPIPTFQPMEGDPMKPDMSKPWHDSKAVPSFGQQTVLSIAQLPTNQGHFDLGTLVLSEHHGTHLDTSAHYVNTEETMEPGGIAHADRKQVHQLGAEDLIGQVVFIDISGRVQAELEKNGGKPSTDPAVTDFSNDSANVVTADDIDAIADKIADGVWLVLNLGWSDFYFQGSDFAADPYINSWNFPGMNNAAIDKLIEIEDRKGFRIGGIVADNIGIDSGEASKGTNDKFSNAFRSHVRGLQRGWKFIENAANLGLLAMAKPDSCTLIVGAPKHVRGSGGPSRVLAMCEK